MRLSLCLLFALSLVPFSSFAQVDPQPDGIGIYFDDLASINSCERATALSSIHVADEVDVFPAWPSRTDFWAALPPISVYDLEDFLNMADVCFVGDVQEVDERCLARPPMLPQMGYSLVRFEVREAFWGASHDTEIVLAPTSHIMQCVDAENAPFVASFAPGQQYLILARNAGAYKDALVRGVFPLNDAARAVAPAAASINQIPDALTKIRMLAPRRDLVTLARDADCIARIRVLHQTAAAPMTIRSACVADSIYRGSAPPADFVVVERMIMPDDYSGWGSLEDWSGIEPGQEYVAFLHRRETDTYSLVNGPLGLYRIEGQDVVNARAVFPWGRLLDLIQLVRHAR
jgi:hypothetical protein